MTLALTTAPAAEPVTRANVKTKLGIQAADTSSDTQIDWMIPAARRWVENRTGRALISQTWTLYLDAFPCVIRLPMGHVSAVNSVKYVATDGTLTTLSASDYQTDLVSEPARVAPSASASVWPIVRGFTLNTVQVEFVAGYGASAANVPDDIVEALYRIIGHWLNNQAAIEQGTSITRVPFAVEQMLSPYVLTSFGPAC